MVAILVINSFPYAQNTILQTLTLFNLHCFYCNAAGSTFGIT